MPPSAPPPAADNGSTPTPAPTSATPAPTESTTAARETTPAPAVPSDDGDEPSDIIDMETLLQILDLDEEDNHEFSKGMAWAYFSQAAETFEEMDAAYQAKDLPKLSSLGHFLKGSSAALGVSKVQASCEQVQHYGDLRDEEANRDLTEDEALALIDSTLKRVKIEYAAAEKWLKGYYEKLQVPA